MSKNEPRLLKLPLVRNQDRDLIKDLHALGSLFQNAVGAYMTDNPSKFPKGTLGKLMSQEDEAVLHGLLNTRSDVDETMSMADMEAQSIHVGLHIHCLFMGCAEGYLQSLNIPFEAIADSVKVNVADKADITSKLDACDRYNLAPMKRFLELKLAKNSP